MDLSQGFQAFTDQLVNTVERYSVDFDGSLVQTSEIRDIANQIIESIKFTVRPGQTSMEMQLNPESLGKVNFSVQAKNGVMSAQFIVENHLTKEAIESHLTILRDALDQQGIKVEVIEVTVSEFSFTQNNQANSEGHMQEQSSGNRNNISIRNKITLEEAIAMDDADDDNVDSVDQMAELRGNQVDYIA
jgi:flagellar hook-length control protein FliK